MFGRIDLLASLIIALSGVACLTDILWGRVYNWLNGSAIAIGLILSISSAGWTGLGTWSAALVLGFVLYGWMFGLGFMGAGDVKLLMAFGALGGVRFEVETAFLGVALGGVLALFLLIIKGRLFTFLKKMRAFVLSILVRELEVALPKMDRGAVLPYAVPLGVAACWTYFAHPLVQWGLIQW